MTSQSCRLCGERLTHTFCDLGVTPLSNAFLTVEALGQMEPFYPLHAYVCEACYLVQLQEFESPQRIFSDYAYFSSYSDTWLAHARQFAHGACERFGLSRSSLVVEIASNDGYLLQFFKAREIPVLGIEPAQNVAAVSIDKGIPTLAQFFGSTLAAELGARQQRADLLVGNNVLAHVPDLNDFVAGMKIALKPRGVISMEFPHLLRLIEGNQFDTIYHEHFSYFSLITAENAFGRHGLVLFDVEEIPTHGGSLRIYVRHVQDDSKPVTGAVGDLKRREHAAQLDHLGSYAAFGNKVQETKRALLQFLIGAKRANKSIAAYGAPAKGNTLLNYCGVRRDFIDYTVDLSPHKQGRFLPGTRIPIYHPDKIRETRPDYLLILPWNLRGEIAEQMAHIREWGGRFVVPIPEVEVVE